MKISIKVFAAVFAFLLSAQGKAADVKEWTILVYMNADNNLYRFGLMNTAEMERVGSSPQVNVVLEMDPEPSGMPTTRYYITQNPSAQPGKITSQVLSTHGETDMGDWKHLAEFITWGVKTYPAKHYAVIIWNHGAGWEGVSYDDNPRHGMTIPELSQGLKVANQQIRQIQASRGLLTNEPVLDIVNFDACLMSTIEVAFEIKDQAKILVGSQFLEPGEGEDYTAFLKPLIAKPDMSASDFSQVMVYQYAARYATGGSGINYIALDLAKMGNFTQAFAAMSEQQVAAPQNIKNGVKSAYSSNSFEGDLIGGMLAAQKVSMSFAPLAKSIDQIIQMYGYPAETGASAIRTESGRKAYRVVRNLPSTVHYRYSNNTSWTHQPLERQTDGTFAATMPAASPNAQMEYVVSRDGDQSRGPANPVSAEARSIIVREGNDPIVFHNKFPASSPVIADAYNHSTKGAHGMTVYFFANALAKKQNMRPSMQELLGQYMQLAFAKIGAPAWAKFFLN